MCEDKHSFTFMAIIATFLKQGVKHRIFRNNLALAYIFKNSFSSKYYGENIDRK